MRTNTSSVHIRLWVLQWSGTKGNHTKNEIGFPNSFFHLSGIEHFYITVIIRFSNKRSLRSWRYGAREIKFWRQSRQKRAAKPREIPPAGELGYFECRHFYHLIDLN